MERVSELEKQQEEVWKNSLFPAKKNKEWIEVIKNLREISEIRIRVNKPVLIYLNGKEKILGKNGEIQEEETEARFLSESELNELVDHWCQNSRYAFENQTKQGFLTLKYGHRVGICGEPVLDDKDTIQRIKYISSVNIRIAHEKKGVAEKILPYLYEKNRVKNLLIISPPGAGKTTMLRDLIRIISDGNSRARGQNVALIDERKEIAACYQGIPQLEIGKRTDIMDGCSKIKGMRMVLRSMSPDVIAVDEIGEEQELSFICHILQSGSSIIASVHGDSYEKIRTKKMFRKIFQNDYFELILELKKEENQFHTAIYEGGNMIPCFIC